MGLGMEERVAIVTRAARGLPVTVDETEVRQLVTRVPGEWTFGSCGS